MKDRIVRAIGPRVPLGAPQAGTLNTAAPLGDANVGSPVKSPGKDRKWHVGNVMNCIVFPENLSRPRPCTGCHREGRVPGCVGRRKGG